MQLCKFKDMDKCAKEFCDFWSNDHQMCACAVEVHTRIRIMDQIEDILRDYTDGRKEEIADQILKSLINVGITIQ
jgi:hypothetical protein